MEKFKPQKNESMPEEKKEPSEPIGLSTGLKVNNEGNTGTSLSDQSNPWNEEAPESAKKTQAQKALDASTNNY